MIFYFFLLKTSKANSEEADRTSIMPHLIWVRIVYFCPTYGMSILKLMKVTLVLLYEQVHVFQTPLNKTFK